MYRLLLLILLGFTGFSENSVAQTQVRLTIRVNTLLTGNNTRKGAEAAVPFANIQLQYQPDSTVVLRRTADSSGVLVVDLPASSKYNLTITAVGFQPAIRGITLTAVPAEFRIRLEPLPNSLKEVVVSAKKPLMRQEEDKTVVDPEQIATTSTSAYEVMEKIPGLYVDQDGNIYISSTTPAQVLINGREMRMSAADIATMLKSLPPGSIQKIEVIRTPSAKYDASGSGGVVNVILKKGVKIGITGSANTGMNQGTYGNQYAGMNISNNGADRAAYFNVQLNHRDGYELINTNRLLAADTLLQQAAITRQPANSGYLGYGFSREFAKSWEWNYDGRVHLNYSNQETNNGSDIRSNLQQVLYSSNHTQLENNARNFSLNQFASLRNKLDTSGSEWNTDLTWNFNQNQTQQNYQSDITVPVLMKRNGDGEFLNFRHYLAWQTDLKKKYPKEWVLEAGLKYTWLNFHSNTGFFRTDNDTRKQDTSRTNTFQYREEIRAAYVQASKTVSGIVFKAGVRLEQTLMNGHQRFPSDTNFSIHRTDFFPYVYINRQLLKIAGYPLKGYLVFRRTISRPGYEMLNPFSRFVDQYVSEKGNPALRPQFTYNYEFNISVDQTPLVAIGYNDTRDIFNQVMYQSDSSRAQAFRTFDNLGRNRETYIRLLGAIPPGGAYFFVLGAQYNYNHYEGLYENRPLSFKRASWLFFTYHTLKLGKLSVVSLNGFMRVNGQQQFYELGNFGGLTLSVNRQFFQKKLTVTASMNDLFFTNNNTFRLNQGTVQASGYRETDTRRFGINLRYNFGIRKKEENNNPYQTESGERN